MIERVTIQFLGEKICHGCLVILRLFKIINLRNILIEQKILASRVFDKHNRYMKKIVIKIRKTSKVIM